MNTLAALPSVTVKPSPAGFALLASFYRAAQDLAVDLVVTSGSDGEHSGPDDPHHSGDAFDLRSHTFAASQKDVILRKVLNYLGVPTPAFGGYVTSLFFGWIENANGPDEHFHFQLRKGMQYPPSSSNAEAVQDAIEAS